MENAADLLKLFVAHLKVLNRSPKTIESYGYHVRVFLESMTVGDVREITDQMIEAYLLRLKQRKTRMGTLYSSSSVSLAIRSIKRFFECLEYKNMIFIDPAEFIQDIKHGQSLPGNVLTSKEVRKMLDQADLTKRTGLRDRAIMEVFYSSGLRIVELCALTVPDMDMESRMVRVNNGKGGKDRVVPLGKHAARFLREYIGAVRPEHIAGKKRVRSLFVSKYGVPISVDAVGSMIRKYARAAGIKKRITAHSFRHAFATGLVRNGADVRAVQQMMGHVKLNTTQVYIQSLGLEVKTVHRETHPRERDVIDPGKASPEITRRIQR